MGGIAEWKGYIWGGIYDERKSGRKKLVVNVVWKGGGKRGWRLRWCERGVERVGGE